MAVTLAPVRWSQRGATLLIMGPLKRSTLLILNLMAVITYLVVGWTAGSFGHIDASVFSSQDSREYREVADWIFGARPSSVASNWRPFLYPLLLGVAERVGGVRGVWLLNVAVWFIALNFCAAATYRFVKSELAAILVFVVLATNLSLMMITYQGLTEPTVIALLAIWVYGLSRLTRRPTPAQVAWVLLPVTLAVVVKPEFEFLLAVVAVVLVVGIIRSAERGLAAAVFAACMIPVGIQLWVMVHFNGYFGFSNVGTRALREYFLPRVDVAIGQSSDLQAAQLRMAGISYSDATRYLLNHAGDAVLVFASTVRENLLAGSNFLTGHPHIEFAILVTQLTFFAVLIAMIPIVCVALWRARDGRLALTCFAALNVFLASGVDYNQGDRYAIVALPLWLPALALAIKEVGQLKVLRSSPKALRTASNPTIRSGTSGPESGAEQSSPPNGQAR